MTEKDGWPGDLYRSFEHSARTSPDATALTFRKQCWSYRELERAATACGSNLASVLPANSPVLVSVDTPAEAIETLLGTWYAGCIAVPVDPRWPEATLRGMAQLIEPAAAVLTDPTNRTGELYRLEGVRCWALGELRTTSGCIERRLIDPDAIGYVGTTSGSTGQPKAVFQTHRQRHAFNLGLKRLVGVLPCDRVSMLHGYGFQVGITDFMGGLLAGATVCAYDIQADGYEGLADWVHRERLTVFHWIPSPWRRFLSTLPQDCKFHGVRWFVLGSEPFPARDVAGIRRHFGDDVRIANRLGIGECGTVACHEVSGTESSEATLPAGKIQPGFEVVITDETGAQCPPGVTGEIRVRGKLLACGYWGRPDLVADSFRELDGGLREFRTRDLGRLTEDGDLQHLGRADLLERIAGQYVAPSAMEASMLRHPGIREAAVVKEKSREGDTLLRAYAVASPEAEVSQASLVALLSREFPPEHLPVELRFVESFPLTATGKLDRQSLAALPPVRPALDAATEPPRGELEELVAEWWRQVLGVNHFGRNDSFFLVGGDSLRLTRVLARLSAELEVAVSPREVWPDPTIRGISELILSKVE